MFNLRLILLSLCILLITIFFSRFIYPSKIFAQTFAQKGDTNGDGVIDIIDYNFVVSCFGNKANTSSCPNKSAADINKDGVVDGIDYTIIIKYFGQVDTTSLDNDLQTLNSSLNQIDTQLNSVDQSLSVTPVNLQ